MPPLSTLRGLKNSLKIHDLIYLLQEAEDDDQFEDDLVFLRSLDPKV